MRRIISASYLQRHKRINYREGGNVMKCSGCLKPIDNAGYCRKCLKNLFGGRKFEQVLPFNSPYKEELDLYRQRTKKPSISGVQVKYSMRLEDNTLILTDKNGQYILKPIPVN